MTNTPPPPPPPGRGGWPGAPQYPPQPPPGPSYAQSPPYQGQPQRGDYGYGQGQQPWGMAPPRPKVTAGSLIVLAGCVAMVVGSTLPWFTFLGSDVTGFTEIRGETRDGPVFLLFAVVLGGLAIALLAAGRVLAVAIIGVVFAAIATIAAVADLIDVHSSVDDLGGGASVKFGLWVVLAGAVATVVGFVMALARRRA